MVDISCIIINTKVLSPGKAGLCLLADMCFDIYIGAISD